MQKHLNSINVRVIVTIMVVTFFVLVFSAGFTRYTVQNEIIKITEQQHERCLEQEKDPKKCEFIHVPRKGMYLKDIDSRIDASVFTSILFALLASVALALVVSTQIVKPLKFFKKNVSKINTDYSVRIEEVGPTEIKELVREFNRLLEKLQNIEKLREDLVSDVTHELKTPLSKIKGRTEGMIDEVYDLDEKNLEKVLVNVDQLEYLINRLQDLVQIQSGKTVLNFQKVNLLNMVDEIVDDLDQKDLKVNIQIDEKLTIKADKYKLREILTNLIENAFKYTKSGKIEILANKEKIEIRDTGIGIEKDEVPFIFERFYRAEKSRNRKTGGLGLGLSITKGLVEAHGWSIGVESEVGKGSVFKINL